MSCPTLRRAWGSAVGQVRAAGALLLAAAVGVVVPASAEQGQGPSVVHCDLRQVGTKLVCERPADGCVNALPTNYTACINDTMNDRVPPESIANWVQDPTAGNMMKVPYRCSTYTQYKCKCTRAGLGENCAIASSCERGEVIATIEIEGTYSKIVRCRPVPPTPAPAGPASAE